MKDDNSMGHATRQVRGSERVRREHDLIGEREIPADVYWGIHTLRALENFPITGTPIGAFAELVRALALVKQAAAQANLRLGNLPPEKADAIIRACRLIADEGRFHDQFVVDAVQGGAGTSTNMNANEVIANVALELMGHSKGDYASLHPNDDVNMAQSTNDAYPTAARLAVAFAAEPMLIALEALAAALDERAKAFSGVIKMGRTQLQDAVPMTLGQEFAVFAAAMRGEITKIREASALLLPVNLGGTAIGTGIGADARYAAIAVEELARISGLEVTLAPNLIEATSDVGAFVSFSSALKRLALKLSKIASDLRLLSSGPRAGLGEIRLPPMQAGSSIMPGKVNPVIPEVVNQVAFLVIGHDLTITLCAEGGQLQLNAFEPTIVFCLLSSLHSLAAAVTTFTERCVVGIEAQAAHCGAQVANSIGLVTALAPRLGYEAASRIAGRALLESRSVAELVLEAELMTSAELERALDIEAMTRPGRI